MSDPRASARQSYLIRGLLGAAMIAVPGLVGRVWIGDVATHRGVRAILRGFGMRDVFLAVATVRAIDDGRPIRELLHLGAACDAIDALLAVTGGSDITRVQRLSILAIAGGAAAQGLSLAARVDGERSVTGRSTTASVVAGTPPRTG